MGEICGRHVRSAACKYSGVPASVVDALPARSKGRDTWAAYASWCTNSAKFSDWPAADQQKGGSRPNGTPNLCSGGSVASDRKHFAHAAGVHSFHAISLMTCCSCSCMLFQLLHLCPSTGFVCSVYCRLTNLYDAGGCGGEGTAPAMGRRPENPSAP